MIGKPAIFALLLALASLPWLCGRGSAQDSIMAQRINGAIDRGAAYLQKYCEKNPAERNRPGAAALFGLALLETGAATDSAALKKIVAYIRQSVPDMEDTYDIAVALIFLAKHDDSADVPLIESLAVRLLAGQTSMGGWEYGVNKASAAERARLTKLVADADRLRAQGLIVRARKRTAEEVARDLDRQLKALPATSRDASGDNSNTQFAMLALWIARRYGVPVTRCMEKVEKRFRTSQVKTGVWGYVVPESGTAQPVDDTMYAYPAMTCAGLLGLALGEGVRPMPRDLLKDSQVQRGLDVLARSFESRPVGNKTNHLFYLFSLERMAVIYNVKKIGAHDWYLKGAADLLEAQHKEGFWNAGFGNEIDTCFALLFLKRANVARDLTEILEVPRRKNSGSQSRQP